MHQLQQGLPQGQGHPQVRDQEHCRGRRRQRYLRGLRLLFIRSPEALRKIVLLRILRDSLQSGQEQVSRSQKGQVINLFNMNYSAETYKQKESNRYVQSALLVLYFDHG